MNDQTSPDTKAILLLTSSLGAKQSEASGHPLSPAEYRKVARQLHELKCSPSTLIAGDATSEAVIEECVTVISSDRLRRLLARGLLLSQALERWSARGIWIASKLDSKYPERIRSVMRGDAPAVLFGIGDTALLDRSALAIVGSRKADVDVIAAAEEAARVAADHDIIVVSGGAKGIDRTAMFAALGRGGCAAGVLADSLERAVLEPAYRDALRAGRVLLLSPFDPSARFQIWTAMQRNKIIYAAADAALVVESAVAEGGTWAGAVEQLCKLRYVPIFVRADGPPSAGLEALRRKGATNWPQPKDRGSFMDAASETRRLQTAVAAQLDLQPSMSGAALAEPTPEDTAKATAPELNHVDRSNVNLLTDASGEKGSGGRAVDLPPKQEPGSGETPTTPAEVLFAHVRAVILDVLGEPRPLAEVASILAISKPQAKAWLDRMVQDGDLAQPKGKIYVRQPSLL